MDNWCDAKKKNVNLQGYGRTANERVNFQAILDRK